MSKRLILILTLAFVVGISFAAFAEVQNVKVSGDITVSGVYRNHFTLAKTPVAPIVSALDPGNKQSIYSDKESDFLTITRVRVDADLTDNVAVCVRLLNERNWNGESTAGLSENNKNIGLNVGTPGFTSVRNAQEEDEITLDLAYVTLKEFLYSPLTITAGRQEIRFGNGWLIGDPDTNGYALRSALAEGDLSVRKSFDAFRATLDYNPLVVDMIFAKISENNTVLNDDITLSGINANYALDKNTTIEGFFFSKITGTNAPVATNLDGAYLLGQTNNKADKVFTVGSRVVNKTVKNLTIDAQGAFQFGTYNPKFDPNASTGAGTLENNAGQGIRRAWGMEAMATYDLKDIQKIAKYKPALSAAYVYLSGEARARTGDKTYHGWDPMFEDQTFGHILNAVMQSTNMSLTGLSLQAKPMDDITAKLDYVTAWFNKRYRDQMLAELSGVSNTTTFNMGKTKHIGQEIDLTLTYDYTEDVQFSLLGGVLFTAKSINPGRNDNLDATIGAPGMAHDLNRATATEVIGTMKVTF